MATHEFLDHSTGAAGTVRALVIDETSAGEHGVRHDGCTDLAPVMPSLNVWQCTTCNLIGHIDGAWATQLWNAEAVATEGA